MKKIILFLLPFLVAFFGLTKTTNAQDVNNFKISNFNASYHLSKDSSGVGQLDIAETITAIFPNYDQNHGIERAIPKTYKDNSLDLKIESVQDQNAVNQQYSTRTENDNLVLRIGSPNSYVHGAQTYIIKYKVSNVITFFESNDELFWDINGDDWSQTFDNVSATLTIDGSLTDSALPEKRCYTGSFGSTESNCSIDEVDGVAGKSITFQTNGSLGPAQTLSIVVGFQPGAFQKPPLNIFEFIGTIFALLASILVPVITLFVLIKKWRKEGRDAKGKGIIVPEYAPPKNMNTSLADIILSERLSTKAVTAGIIELCVNGYVKIYEQESKKFIGKKTEYDIELVKKPDKLSAESQKIASMLFTGLTPGTKLNINEQKNKLYTKLKGLSSLAEENVAKLGYFTSKPSKARSRFYLLAILYLFLRYFEE